MPTVPAAHGRCVSACRRPRQRPRVLLSVGTRALRADAACPPTAAPRQRPRTLRAASQASVRRLKGGTRAPALTRACSHVASVRRLKGGVRTRATFEAAATSNSAKNAAGFQTSGHAGTAATEGREPTPISARVTDDFGRAGPVAHVPRRSRAGGWVRCRVIGLAGRHRRWWPAKRRPGTPHPSPRKGVTGRTSRPDPTPPRPGQTSQAGVAGVSSSASTSSMVSFLPAVTSRPSADSATSRLRAPSSTIFCSTVSSTTSR